MNHHNQQSAVVDFKSLGITPKLPESLIGEKIRIEKILNREVIIEKYRIEPSKYPGKGNGQCLYLQLDIDNSKRVLFTGGTGLIDTIQRIPAESFPFRTTIIKDNDRLIFT